MSTEQEALTILLANRSYLYRLLQRIFSDEPSMDLLKVVTSTHTREALSLHLGAGGRDEDVYLDLFNNLKKDLQCTPEKILEELTSEYTYLLIGPGEMPAPPWGSVYLSNEERLFQESTLEVRKAYLKYQLLPTNYPREADDHIALELDFMAQLAQNTKEQFSEENIPHAIELVRDQKDFLEKNLVTWINDFAKDMQRSKSHLFYPQMATLTASILEKDKMLVDEILSVL